MKRQTGFTLVELVIVIAVLGILAGLAIPYFMEAREEAAKKECLANRTQIMRMFHAQ
ncbi:type IV pilin protein, partial [Phascolarctobacterium faecium]